MRKKIYYLCSEIVLIIIQELDVTLDVVTSSRHAGPVHAALSSPNHGSVVADSQVVF